MNLRMSSSARATAITLLVVYWLLLFVSTHTPSGAIPHPRVWDKLLHFSAYGGLTFLLAWPVTARSGPSVGTYVYLLVIAACYGAVDELGQILVPGRSAEIGDWVADMMGAVVGLAAYRLCLAAVTTIRSQTAEARRPITVRAKGPRFAKKKRKPSEVRSAN